MGKRTLDHLVGGGRTSSRKTGRIFVRDSDGTPITERWVIEDVRAIFDPGRYAEYTVYVLGEMGMDVTGAEELINKGGIAEYINMRMKEAEGKEKNRIIEDERDSAITVSQGIQILKILRTIDYSRRTPREGIPTVEGPKRERKVRYDHLGHECPTKP